MAVQSQARLPKPRHEESAREAILDAAERLFAERGIDAVSLRTINAEAGYSVAALHYHFGTRDGLVRALLERALPPIDTRRAAMLAALAGEAEPPLEALVGALVHPLTAGFAAPVASLSRLRFLMRLAFDRSPHLASARLAGLAQFRPYLRRALPRLEPGTLARRWLIAADLALPALGNALAAQLEAGGRGAPPRADFERFLGELVAFICAGLRAP